MINYSKPRFVSSKDVQSIDKSKNKATAFCRCPLPILIEIDGVLGGYYHIVEYEKTYKCKDCGTVFSVGKHF